MGKILNKLNRSPRETGEARKKGFLMVFPKAKRTGRRDFAIRPPQGVLKDIMPAIKIFCSTETKLLSLIKALSSIKTPLLPPYFIYNHSQSLTKPFDYPSILIKILQRTKMFLGIGQELNVLHKSYLLILTLSQKFSLLRAIENSSMGIVDSQERRLTKGG